MENLKKSSEFNTVAKESSMVSFEKTLGENYKSLGKCLIQLRSVLDSDKPYPGEDQHVLHIYRHDEFSLGGDTRRVHYTFEDGTDGEAQSVDALNELIRVSCQLMMDYMKESNSKRYERGDNVDCDGWNVEMVSGVFDGHLYAVNFNLYFIDFDNSGNELEYELSLDDVEDILLDISKQ